MRRKKTRALARSSLLHTSVPPEVAGSEGIRTRVFLSYSRKDLDFVTRLSSDLNARGCVCDFDVADSDSTNVATGISAEDAWWARLQDMITLAQVIVFIVSPDSTRSKVCDEEVAFALGLAKRVIAVTYRTLDFSKLPPRLSSLNMSIHFRDGTDPDYKEALTRLANAVQLDVRWHRTAAEVALAARRWDSRGRQHDALVQGSDLRDIQDWAARRPSTASPHSELVLAYLTACQNAEAERRAITESEKARHLELMEIARPLLEAEIRAREELPPSDHPGVRKEQEVELERLRSLLQNRWHPRPARHLASTGAVEGYAEIFVFPCCNRAVRDFLSTGDGDPPFQFRTDGCEEIPKSLQHGYRSRSNPFRPVIASRIGGKSGARE
jgi:TIR domain